MSNRVYVFLHFYVVVLILACGGSVFMEDADEDQSVVFVKSSMVWIADFAINHPLWFISIVRLSRFLGAKVSNNYARYNENNRVVTNLHQVINKVSLIFLTKGALCASSENMILLVENVESQVECFAKSMQDCIVGTESLREQFLVGVREADRSYIADTNINTEVWRDLKVMILGFVRAFFNEHSQITLTYNSEGSRYEADASIVVGLVEGMISGIALEMNKHFPVPYCYGVLKYFGYMVQYVPIAMFIGGIGYNMYELVYSEKDAKANDEFLDIAASTTLVGLSFLVSWQVTLAAAVAKTAYDYGVSEGIEERHYHYLCSVKCFIGTGVNTVADWFGGEFEVNSCYHMPIDLVGDNHDNHKELQLF